MNRKNLLKAFCIITPITFTVTFLLLRFGKWIDYLGLNSLMCEVIITFSLAYVLINYFKRQIKLPLIFLLIFCGILLSNIYLYFTTNWQGHIDIILYSLFIYTIPLLFAWGFCAVKNKYLKVGLGLAGLCYIHLFISNQYAFELIEWVMYIIVFVYGIRICKKYESENNKMIYYSLLALAIFEIFAWIATILENILGGLHWYDLSVYAFVSNLLEILSLWFAYCLGFWFVKSKKLFIKILLPVVVILLALFLLKFVRYEIAQKFEKETWTGEIFKPAKLSEIEFFTDSTLNKVTIKDLQKEIYVLDFYNNNCGVCFREMPKFQTLAEKYKENTDIGFYAVNVFRDTINIAQAQRFLEKQNINLPLLFICEKDEKYVQNFGYKLFPQYNIVKNDTIIFDGYFEILDFFERKYLK